MCKREFGAGQSLSHEDLAYLYTFRFLLERLSWLSRDTGLVLDYTLPHVVRFKLAKLRIYEARRRAMGSGPMGTAIEWAALDPKGGRLNQPNRMPGLQLADIAASSTFAAFEPDQFGNTERRYLSELAPRLYRRGAGSNALTSYGFKMHPWNSATQAKYARVRGCSTTPIVLREGRASGRLGLARPSRT